MFPIQKSFVGDKCLETPLFNTGNMNKIAFLAKTTFLPTLPSVKSIGIEPMIKMRIIYNELQTRIKKLRPCTVVLYYSRY